MFINLKNRQLNLKVVYYGPALSGKTTNLEQIHARMDPRRRGELVSLKTAEDRTLFFDFLQLELGKINGLTPNIQLYTVPGQTYYQASRKVVLKGADGVVFVADSAAKRLGENLESWRNLHTHLDELNMSLDRLPLVLQLNKQDLRNALAPDLLTRALQANGYPTFCASAVEGKGVLDTLKAIINGVVSSIQRELA
jgi:mutual gliding-motility protein MglA